VAVDRPALGVRVQRASATRSLAWHRDGTALAYAGEDGHFGFWRPAGERATPEEHFRQNERLTTVAYSADGTLLAFGSRSGLVEIVSVNGGTGATTERRITLRKDVMVSAVAFRPPHARFLAYADLGGRVVLLDLDDGARVTAEFEHPDRASVRAIAFSPDGQLLVSADNAGRLLFWRVGDDGQIVPIDKPVEGAHKDGVTSLAFSADGRWLHSGGLDRRVLRWDAASRRPSGQEIATRAGVMSVAVSPDGKSLAAGLSGGGIALWDLETGSPVLEDLPGHQLEDGASGDITFGVAFSPDGSRLASVGSDGTLRLWDLDVQSQRLIAKACDVARRKLTRDEWPSVSEPPAEALDPCGIGRTPPSRP
jgi:WD40 repeat protein